MFKYFENLKQNILKTPVSDEQINDYKACVMCEMIKLKTNDAELAFIDDEMIVTSIRNNHKPKDMAWAILQ